MESISFLTEQINNMNVNYLKTDKFKTNTIIVNIAQDLTEENVTKIALLPYFLKRGSKQYKNIRVLQEKLDDLYGAFLNVYIFKRGEKQIVQFSIEVANEKYLNEQIQLLTEAIQLLGEIITNPLISENSFNNEFLTIEKEMLRNRVKGIFDDKIQYAEYKTIEHMCKDEPYHLLEDGRIEDLDKISAKNLYTSYQKWINSAPIDMYIVGDIQNERLAKTIKNSFRFNNRRIESLLPLNAKFPIQKERMVIDELNVTQGKLNIGLRTFTSIKDDEYPELLLFNGILGGFAHSKLFVNVREKASLAYYASSRLDSHKGIIIIQSGIEVDKFSQALDIIKQQVGFLKNGDITKNELEQTKALLINQFKEILDIPRFMADFAYHSVLSGRKRSYEDILDRISNVTIDNVVNIAKRIEIDTIYFLKGKDKE